MNKAEELHKDVPPGWYHKSLKEDFLQRVWHKERFKQVSVLIEPVEGEVLDIGSADGVFTNIILKATKAKKITGVDVVNTSVVWAKKHWKNNKKMKFLVADAHKLPFRANTFDAVFALEVLEHIENPKKVFQEICRVLKKGAYAVLLVPSESLLFKIVWFLWQFYGRMVWKDTHIQSFDNRKLSKMLKIEGFQVEVDKKTHLGMLHLVKVRKKS